jgi:3-methyladenine DNA glycosylase AlkD
MVREWLADHRTWTPEQVLRTVKSLLAGPSYEEKTSGCMIIKERREVRRLVSPAQVEAWLDDLRGWAEVDSLCQSMFSADELLSSWVSWRARILRLSKSDNTSCRRGALVLLTAPVRQSTDKRLHELAIRVLDQVRTDRSALITKAVSWLLRSLTENHSKAVIDYLDRFQSDLAPVALRETRIKLRTGTKSGKSKSRA